MKRIILLLFVLVSFTGVRAGDDFDRAVTLLMSQNPELQAAVANARAEVEDLKSENNLPETEVGFSHRRARHGEIKTGVEINQGFDWPGIYGARSRQQNLTRKALQLLNKSRAIEKEVALKQLIISYIGATLRSKVTDELSRHTEQLLEKYNRAYEAGEVNIIDRNKVIVEYTRAQSQYHTAEAARMAVLSSILDEAADNQVVALLASISDFPTFKMLGEEEYEKLLVERDPLLAYYQQMVAVGRQDEKVARLGWFPSFSLGYAYEHEDGLDFHGFNVGISLPLFSNRHKQSAARFRQIENNINLSARRFKAVETLRTLVAEARQLEESIAHFSIVFDNTNQYALLRKAFEGGEISLLEYLTDINYFTEAQIDYIEARQSFCTILVDLNRFAGE